MRPEMRDFGPDAHESGAWQRAPGAPVNHRESTRRMRSSRFRLASLRRAPATADALGFHPVTCRFTSALVLGYFESR